MATDGGSMVSDPKGPSGLPLAFTLPATAKVVPEGNGKSDTTNRLNEPTSPGNLNPVAVDNQVLPFPSGPGRSILALQAIKAMVAHPSKPSDSFVVKRAVKVLRYGH